MVDRGERRLPAARTYAEATHFNEAIMDTRVQLLSAVAASAALFFAATMVERPAQAATAADFYDLAKPAGDGPFPAVVLAPGCGGFHDQYSPPVFDQYRKRLVEDGFVVVNVDFTKSHDIPACFSDKGLLITQED